MSGVLALFRRDLRVFVLQRSRLLGTLAQPLLIWLVIGAGLAPSFAAGEDGPGYMRFFYPGAVVMMLLMTSISATMSVIEDRHQGFLQGVLAAPVGRWQLALGKTLGGAFLGLIPAVILVLIGPVAGFEYGGMNVIALLGGLILTAIAFTALGFALAWKLDSSAGYHVVMSAVLFPLWILSGAMFPMEPTHPVLAWIGRLNPMSYAVTVVRGGFEGAPAGGLVFPGAILAVVTLAAVGVGVWSCRRR
jgi:ABC-type polysaccharide/polyol phosphate export permease